MDPVQQNAAPSQPAPVQQPVAPIADVHLKTSGFAIAGLVLGIVSLIPHPMLGIPCGILALIFGLVAKSKIKSGVVSGKGMATASVILGIVGIIISIVVTLFFIFIFASFARQAAPAIPGMMQQLQNQAKQQQSMMLSTTTVK